MNLQFKKVIANARLIILLPFKLVNIFFLMFYFSFLKKKTFDDGVLVVFNEKLGDFIMFTTALRHYKEAFPGRQIHLCVPQSLPIDHNIDHFVDKVIFFDNKKFKTSISYQIRFISSLRGKYDVVINSSISQPNLLADMICLGVGGTRIVYHGDSFIDDLRRRRGLYEVLLRKCSFFQKFYTIKVPSIDFDGKIRSVLDQYLAIPSHITGNFPEQRTTITIDENLVSLPILSAAQNDFVVVGIGSGSDYRNWETEKYATVINFLAGRGFRIIFVGIAQDNHIALEIISKCNSNVQYANLVGKTTLNELFYLIEMSRFIVGNETSTIHAAIALKKPSVCILGGGDFGRCSLYGYAFNRWVFEKTACYFDGWQCGDHAHGPSPCISAVSAEKVIHEIESLLEDINHNEREQHDTFRIPTIALRGDNFEVSYREWKTEKK